jgi:hypothetical protein
VETLPNHAEIAEQVDAMYDRLDAAWFEFMGAIIDRMHKQDNEV